MEDRDPIKQLQHLLDDPGKVLEKISRIQSALGSIKGAENVEEPSPPAAKNPSNSPADNYHSLLQALRDLQLQIEDCLRPLAVQVVEAETQRLNDWLRRERQALEECLGRIDQSLLACAELIHESQRKYADLSALKKRLEDLGASPSAVPEVSPSADASAIIKARLEGLRRDGKI